MRDMLSRCLVNQVKTNSNTYILSGDHGYALFDELRKSFPNHFLNAGVAEQNMVGVAAGLSKLNFYPIVYGLSAFIPIRVLEQIKIDFCYEKLPGLFLGDGAGFVYSHLGTSHQSTEDLACLKALPHLQIFSPADKFELEYFFNEAVKSKITTYIRIGKADLGDIHIETMKASSFMWTHGPIKVLSSKLAKTAYLATGSMVKTAQNTAKAKKMLIDVYSVPCIKPFDEEKYAALLNQYENVVSFEEHSVFNGLGDSLASVVAGLRNTSLKKIGVQDRFSEKCGTYDYLLKEHKLDLESILVQLG